MGKKRDTPGVEVRGGSLRVYFRYEKTLCREPLNLKPTAPNKLYALRLVDEIRARIRAGIFDYGEYFPDSKRAATSKPTFAQRAEEWLATLTDMAASTRESYKKIVNNVWMPRLADRPIEKIAYSELAKILAEHPWKTGKTRNNALIPVRAIFDVAFVDGVIKTDPTDRLRSAKHQKPLPDPLDFEEVEIVLAWLNKNRPEPIWNYYELAIFAGLRPSEQIAEIWPDIDLRRGIARIQRAKVWGQSKDVTKTYQIRDIELNSRALAALRRQKKHTYLAGKEVFLDPITGQPFVDDKPPRLHWNAALKATGVRQRVAYQTRHTFATLNLMAGANPMWVAQQMGHTTMKMVLERYAKWIPQADRSEERGKLDRKLKNGNIIGNIRGNPGQRKKGATNENQ